MLNVLSLGGLRYGFGKQELLKDIYMQLKTGRISALLGRNGSGKSTLLHILSGAVIAKDSCFRLNDTNLKDPSKCHGLINICPQFSFIPSGFSIQKIATDYQFSVDDFNRFFDAQMPLSQKFGNLSGGIKRLLELFIVIKSKTLFTILDEPFSSLMPIHIEKIKALIHQENNRKGFIVSDHFYRDVLEISDETYYLKEGRTQIISHIDDLYDLGYVNYVER